MAVRGLFAQISRHDAAVQSAAAFAVVHGGRFGGRHDVSVVLVVDGIVPRVVQDRLGLLWELLRAVHPHTGRQRRRFVRFVPGFGVRKKNGVFVLPVGHTRLLKFWTFPELSDVQNFRPPRGQQPTFRSGGWGGREDGVSAGHILHPLLLLALPLRPPLGPLRR